MKGFFFQVLNNNPAIINYERIESHSHYNISITCLNYKYDFTLEIFAGKSFFKKALVFLKHYNDEEDKIKYGYLNDLGFPITTLEQRNEITLQTIKDIFKTLDVLMSKTENITEYFTFILNSKRLCDSYSNYSDYIHFHTCSFADNIRPWFLLIDEKKNLEMIDVSHLFSKF